MVNPRPSPQKLEALKLEIKLRYKRKARESVKVNRSRSMAAFRLAELTRWLHHTNGGGAELEPSEQSIQIVRLFAHHMGGLPNSDGRIRSWTSTYSPWLLPQQLERLINEVTSCPLKWTADKLGWKIRLTDAVRTELKIKTIGAIDCSKEQRQARQRKRRAARDRARKIAKRNGGSPYI